LPQLTVQVKKSNCVVQERKNKQTHGEIITQLVLPISL